jgi:hypothetical protein
MERSPIMMSFDLVVLFVVFGDVVVDDEDGWIGSIAEEVEGCEMFCTVVDFIEVWNFNVCVRRSYLRVNDFPQSSQTKPIITYYINYYSNNVYNISNYYLIN